MLRRQNRLGASALANKAEEEFIKDSLTPIFKGNLVRAFCEIIHPLAIRGQEVVLFAKLALGPSKNFIQPASIRVLFFVLSSSSAQSRHLVELGRFNNDY